MMWGGLCITNFNPTFWLRFNLKTFSLSRHKDSTAPLVSKRSTQVLYISVHGYSKQTKHRKAVVSCGKGLPLFSKVLDDNGIMIMIV